MKFAVGDRVRWVTMIETRYGTIQQIKWNLISVKFDNGFTQWISHESLDLVIEP